MKILLVRHGTTDLHTGDRFWGRTDMPLSTSGVGQAEKLRERLSREKIDTVYTSPLRRAYATAEIIAAGHKINITPCADLCECNFGEVEGMTFAEIEKQYPALARELSDRKTGAFPGGETLEQLNERVQAFLQLLGRHRLDETVLVVAHGGPVRLIICNLLRIGLEHWVQVRIDHASLSIVETYNGTNILNLLNDTSHLEE